MGSSLTVDEAAWGPAEKAAHHAWKRHEIVEMESFWIGEAAAKRGIPFLTARTISDTAEHQLLQTGAMREDGTFDVSVFQAWSQAHPEIRTGVGADRRERANRVLEPDSLPLRVPAGAAGATGAMTQTAPAAIAREALDEAIRRTQDYFLRTQHPDGYWVRRAGDERLHGGGVPSAHAFPWCARR